LEAPPGFEPGWRFCRAIPGDSRAITDPRNVDRNHERSIACGNRPFTRIVSGVGRNWALSVRRGHIPGTALRCRAVCAERVGKVRELMRERTSE
jgi:hypothetical protein